MFLNFQINLTWKLSSRNLDNFFLHLHSRWNFFINSFTKYFKLYVKFYGVFDLSLSKARQTKLKSKEVLRRLSLKYVFLCFLPKKIFFATLIKELYRFKNVFSEMIGKFCLLHMFTRPIIDLHVLETRFWVLFCFLDRWVVSDADTPQCMRTGHWLQIKDWQKCRKLECRKSHLAMHPEPEYLVPNKWDLTC